MITGGGVDWGYLEGPVGVFLVYLETFDGHRTPHVLSAAHFCKSTMIVHPPDTYGVFVKNIRRGDDGAGSAYLGEK